MLNGTIKANCKEEQNKNKQKKQRKGHLIINGTFIEGKLKKHRRTKEFKRKATNYLSYRDQSLLVVQRLITLKKQQR